MFIDFQTTSKPMTLSKLSLWQTPEKGAARYIPGPEKKPKRRLYANVYLFEHENPQGRT